MIKLQIEVILGLISYVCLGIAYTLHDNMSPSEFFEAMREEPGVEDVDQVAPKYVRAVSALVWTVFMLIWPRYFAEDVGYWIWDHTVGRFRKDEEQESKEEDS